MTRTIVVGGTDKRQLLAQLDAAGVRLNDAARELFADERFTTSPVASPMYIVELTVASLGFRDGACCDLIVEQAGGRGLAPCPLETAPHFRLQYTDQPEGSLGQPASRHRAPRGSITVVSAPLASDDDTPRGFYLRRIEGVLWLRGYRSHAGHVWSPEDVLAFWRRDDASRAGDVMP